MHPSSMNDTTERQPATGRRHATDPHAVSAHRHAAGPHAASVHRHAAGQPPQPRRASAAALAACLAVVSLFGAPIPVSAAVPPVSAAANTTIQSIAAQAPSYVIEVDNAVVPFDSSPINRNNRLLVPFRAIAESLGISVEWVKETRTVRAAGEGKTVLLTIDNPTATVDGAPVPLDAAPVIANNRTLIPLRFFAETFGCDVGYDEPTRTAEVRSAPKAMEIHAWYAMDANWPSLFGAAYPTVSTGGTDAIDTVSFGWYELLETGTLSTTGTQGWKKPSGWEQALAGAATMKLGTEMTVWMSDKTGGLTRLMADTAAQDAAAAAITAAAADYGGVNLDLEGLGMTDTGDALTAVRSTYAAFIARVAAPLHAQGKTLTLTLHPLNGAFHGYDYAAAALLADRIAVMAYDYGVRPEPDTKVAAALDLALAEVPAQKLLLGISLASETADSLVTKIGIAKRKGIAGVALWRLGLMQADDWASLRSAIHPLRAAMMP